MQALINNLILEFGDPKCSNVGLFGWGRRGTWRKFSSDSNAEKIHGGLACLLVGSLLETLPVAARSVSVGDAILLSPACSSFDRFRNYQQSGQRFCTASKTISRGVQTDNPNGNGGLVIQAVPRKLATGNKHYLLRGFLRENPGAKN
jgi:hypothetical protein